MTWARPSRKSYTFSRGNQWSTRKFAPGKNGETGKFLWSLSLFIRPERHPDSCINTCFSDFVRVERPKTRGRPRSTTILYFRGRRSHPRLNRGYCLKPLVIQQSRRVQDSHILRSLKNPQEEGSHASNTVSHGNVQLQALQTGLMRS